MARRQDDSSPAIRPIATLLAVALSCLGAAGCSSDSSSDDDGPSDVGIDTSAPGDDTGSVDTGGVSDGVSDTGGGGEDTSDALPQGEDVSVKSFGVLPPMPANCDMPNQRQRVPFYFSTRIGSRIRPIKRGDLLYGEPIRANQTIGAGTLTARRTQVATTSRKSCSTSADCQDPFKCGPSGVRGAENRCTRQTAVEFIPGTARQDYRPNVSADSGQVIAILFENTGMYLGKLPTLVAKKYDENGEQDFDDPTERATDPELVHREAIEKFSTFLATATDPENTKVSPWFFGGAYKARARPMLDAMSRKDHFTDDLELPKDLIQTLDPPAPSPSNVYQSILQVINRDLGIDKYADHEKFLFLVTDGPNEVHDPEATKSKVLSRLDKHDIHLFILHLDSEIDPSTLRDDPRYWAGNENCRESNSCDGAVPCQSDTDCANFETCRKATKYADSAGGSVTQTGVKYCLPDYSNGYLGPIAPYADLACRTGGNYMYTTEPGQLIRYAERIPFMFDGQWSVEAEFSALSEPVGLENGFYRLSGAIFGLLGPNLSAYFSLPSDTGVIQQSSDSRPVLRLQRGNDGGGN